MRDRIATLKKALYKVIKKKSRKRKHVQDGRTLTYDSGLQLASIDNGTVGESTKGGSSKARANGVQLT